MEQGANQRCSVARESALLHCFSMCITSEGELVAREVLEQQGCKVPIFTEVEQILHMQGLTWFSVDCRALYDGKEGHTSTRFSPKAITTSFAMKTGLFSTVRRRYSEKQPGKQVTLPKSDSKAFAR